MQDHIEAYLAAKIDTVVSWPVGVLGLPRMALGADLER